LEQSAFSAMVPYLVSNGFGRPESDIGAALGIFLIATIIAVAFWSQHLSGLQ
jgi:hypothetical protein